MIKSAIVLLYLRIFGSSRYRTVFYVVWTYVILCGICPFFVTIFQCRPISYNWNRAQSGRCIDLGTFWIAGGILNVIGDFLVLLAPIPVVWRLHLSGRRKTVLLGIFSLGSMYVKRSLMLALKFQTSDFDRACIVSVVRLFYIKNLLSFDTTCMLLPIVRLAIQSVALTNDRFKGMVGWREYCRSSNLTSALYVHVSLPWDRWFADAPGQAIRQHPATQPPLGIQRCPDLVETHEQQLDRQKIQNHLMTCQARPTSSATTQKLRCRKGTAGHWPPWTPVQIRLTLVSTSPQINMTRLRL